jgi:hypothetical protein
MTEAEWRSCKYAYEMIEHLREAGCADARKCRLFICASSRVLWDALGHKTHRRLVELAEDYADGLIPFAELTDALTVAAEYREQYETEYDQAEISPGRVAFETASEDAADAAEWACNRAGDVCEYLPHAPGAKQYDGVGLLREIFGNPFRTPSLGPPGVAHPSGTVAALARAAYLHRNLPQGTLDTDRLGVLADALEEAGCVDREILKHLRGRGPHVRGCWVVDLILEQAGGFPAPPKRQKKRTTKPGEGPLHTVEDILAAASRLTVTEIARVQEGLRCLEEERNAPSPKKKKPKRKKS